MLRARRWSHAPQITTYSKRGKREASKDILYVCISGVLLDILTDINSKNWAGTAGIELPTVPRGISFRGNGQLLALRISVHFARRAQYPHNHGVAFCTVCEDVRVKSSLGIVRHGLVHS